MMHIDYDPDADAVYIHLRDAAYAYGKDLDDARRVDYGSDDAPVGIELLNVSKGVNVFELPAQASVGHLLEEYAIKVFA